MPRGADYVDGPVQSDNSIESTENKIAGAPTDGSDNVRFSSVDSLFPSRLSNEIHTLTFRPFSSLRQQVSISRTKLHHSQQASAR